MSGDHISISPLRFSLFLGLCQHTLDDQIWAEDTHGGNSNTGLSSSICGAEAGKDDGGCASHRTEERLVDCQSIVLEYIPAGRWRREASVAGVIDRNLASYREA